MNQLDTHDLHQHVTILGWIHILSNIVFLLIGGFLFLLLTSIGAVSGDGEALAILSAVATFVGGLLALLALPGMAAGYGLLKRKEWGRILALVVGILGLANFPIGTAIGVYTFWVLLQSAAPRYFDASASHRAEIPESILP